MGNPYKKYGEGTIKADGETFEFSDVTYSLSGKILNKTDNGRGFTHKTQGGWVKGKVELAPGMSVDKLMGMDDVTVVWTTDTGQTYTAAHAWVEGEIEVVKDGFEVQFNYRKHQEIVNG